MSISEELIFRQSGREFDHKDVQLIQQTFRMFPTLSQSELLETIGENLNWLTASGFPKRRACKELIIQMEEQGLIQLPQKRSQGAVKRSSPTNTSLTDTPDILEATLKVISPVSVEPVTNDKPKNRSSPCNDIKSCKKFLLAERFCLGWSR
ncbi:hypothetical protein [sulfur-oxidizing endosymbiont of Gigantopelta aegis]|uniref:hypothetical protein n=1 Tax=sulfur-oxidizing endosymbiont of Gigantopelta aegis TaxID=2794934 RepID=UPI0018DB4DA1|nr:hypothetical protein [sulfur-oxidizing endosymbiont of Gigantopelta aegis]